MNNYLLFTDASLNPRLKVGVGGYLFVSESSIRKPSHLIEVSELEKRVVLKGFEETSSTKLEVQSIVWALEEADRGSLDLVGSGKLYIYTDSQCIAGLLPRRAGLESSAFRGKRSDRLLRNAPLYQRFYAFYDRLEFEVIKVAGHTPSGSRNTLERVFSVVDRKVRKALKSLLSETS